MFVAKATGATYEHYVEQHVIALDPLEFEHDVLQFEPTDFHSCWWIER
jgi:hypothetical protein